MAEIIEFIFDEQPKKERWVNVFSFHENQFGGQYEVTSNVYSTKEKALEMAEKYCQNKDSQIKYVGTFKLEEK
jgi:hypothetical protein